jgi:hypothetical protein
MLGRRAIEACGGVVVALLLCLAGTPSALAVPSNDDFANPQALNVALPIEVTGTNVGATQQEGEPGHAPLASGGHTVWFRWEAASTEAVTVSTCGSEMPTIIGVYLGNTLGALTEVASNTWEWPGCGVEEGSQATFRAVVGKSYSIQIDSNVYHEASQPSVSGEGVIQLDIRHRSAPPNDDFSEAEPIQMDGGLSVPVRNFGATKEAGEPDHRGDQGGASVWFKFTAPRTGGAFAQAYGEPVGHEGLVAVYTGSSVSNLTAVPAFETRWTSQLHFQVKSGVTYRIAVDGQYNSATGSPFMDQALLSLSTYPSNDDFDNAFSLGSAPLGGTMGLFGLGNTGATKQAGEPEHAGNRGGASVWFTWRSSEGGSAQLSACGASFDTLLAVYTGSTVGGLTQVAASRNPQSPGCTLVGSTAGEVSFNVDAGTVYRIAVDGYEGGWGGFNLELHTSTQRLPSPPQAMQPQLLGNHRPPRTKIARRHVSSHRRIAAFRLGSSEAGSHFLCRLDSRSFRRCGSSVSYRRLKPGRHVFAAKAVNSRGEADPTPVVFRFRIGRGA